MISKVWIVWPVPNDQLSLSLTAAGLRKHNMLRFLCSWVAQILLLSCNKNSFNCNRIYYFYSKFAELNTLAAQQADEQ